MDGFKISWRHLPHWQASGAVYFLTWRLREDQQPLRPEERSVVAGVLEHFDHVRYRLYAWVVMDDHVHVIVDPMDTRISALLHSWKSYSAH